MKYKIKVYGKTLDESKCPEFYAAIVAAFKPDARRESAVGAYALIPENDFSNATIVSYDGWSEGEVLTVSIHPLDIRHYDDVKEGNIKRLRRKLIDEIWKMGDSRFLEFLVKSGQFDR